MTVMKLYGTTLSNNVRHASIPAPCSAKTYGKYLRRWPRSVFKVANFATLENWPPRLLRCGHLLV
jgi:hypothetical protein